MFRLLSLDLTAESNALALRRATIHQFRVPAGAKLSWCV
jgi:hypothetical protein